MRAPKSLQDLESVITKLQDHKRKAPSQVFPDIENEVQK